MACQDMLSDPDSPSIQSLGDFLGFNSHSHVLSTDGCFYGQGMFRAAPRFETKQFEVVFRHKVFKVLLSKGKITQDLVNILMSWRHSDFNVFCGTRIQPGEEEAIENLARHITGPHSPMVGRHISLRIQRLSIGRRTVKRKKSLMPSNGPADRPDVNARRHGGDYRLACSPICRFADVPDRGQRGRYALS